MAHALAWLASGAAALAVAACAPRQVIEVHTSPPGALVSIERDGARRALGRAPVRTVERGESALVIHATLDEHEPARIEVPGREVDALLDLVLHPRGPLRDELLCLELLVAWGPQTAGGLAERTSQFDATAANRMLEALAEQHQVRSFAPEPAPRSRERGASEGAAGATSATRVYDITLAGLRRLDAALPRDALLERLRASRALLHRRAARAEALLEAARDR